MSGSRMDYHRVAPQAMAALNGLAKYADICSIEEKLRLLVELRVSQINGCAYCVNLHCEQMRDIGEAEQRIDCVTVWRESPFYNQRERAALAWAESVTRVAETHVPDELFEQTSNQFSNIELVDLTTIIAATNVWNRMAISFRNPPTYRQ